MSDYVKRLEQRNDELQEMLAMAESDAATYKWLLPRWREYVSTQGQAFDFYTLDISYEGVFMESIVARVYQTNGISADKIWLGSFEKLRFGGKRFMEFYPNSEIARQEIESIYMKRLRKAAEGNNERL